MLAQPAWAFPAPDLVINLFGSGAQLLGMLTAGLGAAWFGARKGPVRRRRRLGLLTLAALLLALAGNLFQYIERQDERARRLQTNLLRPPAAASTQPVNRSLALDRDTFARWQADKRPYTLIDVREPEELELGRLPGARHSRYADLLTSNRHWLRHDRPNVLVCDSGLRSGELCTQLAAQGLPCHFIAGGYARWIAEGRPMQDQPPAYRGRPPTLPPYRHASTLLDTSEVDRLVQQQQARFLDVRPPRDFATGALPGAINIPVREQSSAALAGQIAKLPPAPLIAACYDNRSCFYAKLLGLRLSRQGFDYRGRYTVPHEYPIPARLLDSPVASYLERQTDRLVAMLAGPPARLLETLTLHPGDLALPIVLLALLLRLLLLPLGLLAERDRLRLRSLPLANASASERRRQLRQAGIHPGRNLLLGLLQWSILAGCLAAVGQAATLAGQGFSWLPHWAQPDPWHLLPALLGLALAHHLLDPTLRLGRWRLPVCAVAGLLLIGLTDSLSAAVNLYLLVSLCLLSLQQAWAIRRWSQPARLAPPAPRPTRLVLPLADAWASTRLVGGKARGLARLVQAGLPVPDGFVLTAAAFDSDGRLTPAGRNAAREAFERLGSAQVAVRSSAANEDGEQQSQAGRYLTRLGIEAAELESAIEQVVASYLSPRAGGVIVQSLLAADYAGVLFTEHPAHGGCLLVELEVGLGSAVVGGESVPQAFCFGRRSGLAFDSATPPFDLAPLLQLAQQIETLAGQPQDIEWAWHAGRFHLLQARPLSRRADDPLEQERARLLQQAGPAARAPQQPWLITDDLCAELPTATALSLSLLSRLRGPGGATDRAWQRLGFDYPVMADSPPLWLSVFGHTRLDRFEAQRRAFQPGLLAQLSFSRHADRLVRAYQEEFLPSFRHSMRLREALDLSRLSSAELLDLWRDWTQEWVETIYVEAEVINLAADLYGQLATRLLLRRGLDPARYLLADRPAPATRALRQLSASPASPAALDAFLADFGHRAGHDFELAEPRHLEQREAWQRWRADSPDALAEPALPPRPTGRLLGTAVAQAQRFLALKEEAKHECVRTLASLRKLLLEIDLRFALDGQIFFLQAEELAYLPADATLRQQAAARAAAHRAQLAVELPPELSLAQLERLTLLPTQRSDRAPTSLHGTRVAGAGPVSGSVRVLRDSGELGRFQQGEILVVATADPAWIPLLPRSAAILCENGGWLCHGAIMAREFDLLAVFGVRGALAQLADGDRVTVHHDGRVEVLETCAVAG
ncbi:PEP/pyruvate-binding domain-containing protein [Chitinimonas lacunae]|uniref:PEP/pyruvate-binding domain-containing protein n=1 Tax=Chitinimonas lacunae TaxID=1963018 RepID=A0ABV8MKI4_9NEIS